ncbi:MAG: 30S ribosome-binding factor RbfA [Gammaproteobacteria bacterium]|nr:MAG: 30S ribosome-binding factor RbfA [Gammaproteobacteria bacterium]
MLRDFPRSRRIEDQIQRLLSDVIRNDVRDPRLSQAIITAVRVSRDLSVAWVYYSVLQADGETDSLDDAFKSAVGFMRSRLAKDLTVRRVPELRFELDETGENARAMDQLIEDAISADKKSGRNNDSDEHE